MRESVSTRSESLRFNSQPGVPAVELGKGTLGQPHWVGCYLLEWEILVYQQANCWEACFFKRDHHHEHVKAFSLSDARRKAEDQIEILETASRPKLLLLAKRSRR